jgi:hypothetical protein
MSKDFPPEESIPKRTTAKKKQAPAKKHSQISDTGLEKAGPSSASKYDEKQFTDSDDSEDNDTIEEEAENQPLRMEFTSALELKMDQFLIVSFIYDKTSKKKLCF